MSKYYPYFRGKQFDLLALKTLALAGRLSEEITPIIEPVKNSASLKGLVKEFQRLDQSFLLVDNPQAGDFLTETGYQALEELPVAKAHIMDQNALTDGKSQVLIVQNALPILRETGVQTFQQPVVVPQEFRVLEKLQAPKILSEDPFTRIRNSGYQELADEFFTDSYRTFSRRGFVGYSDFSLDSRIYYEQTYPSKTMVLHLVYPVKEGLRIRHYTSGEEPEALRDKFLAIMAEVRSDLDLLSGGEVTLGLTLLLENLAAGKFPGMGVMRKASLMHHLEIMGRVL